MSASNKHTYGAALPPFLILLPKLVAILEGRPMIRSSVERHYMAQKGEITRTMEARRLPIVLVNKRASLESTAGL